MLTRILLAASFLLPPAAGYPALTTAWGSEHPDCPADCNGSTWFTGSFVPRDSAPIVVQ